MKIMGESNKEFPYEIKDVDEKLANELMKYFTGELTGFVRVGPKGYYLPHKYKQEALNIYTMPLRSTDVFVSSYPRSGTTWTQELVWMVANNLNYDTSNKIPLTARYTFLEFSVLFHTVLKKRFTEENSHSKNKLAHLKDITQPGTVKLANTPSPRFIKTHLPLSLLPPILLDVAKMIYVARDPRDIAVSFYHLNRARRYYGYVGDFKMFWNCFINDSLHWTPYFENLKEAWARKNHPNMLFLFYEELSKDLTAAVRRVAQFFGKQFTEEEIKQLCEHLSIERFKTNKSINNHLILELGIMLPSEPSFIRRGKVEGWRDLFDEDMTQQAEQWIQDNLRDTDFKFPYFN